MDAALQRPPALPHRSSLLARTTAPLPHLHTAGLYHCETGADSPYTSDILSAAAALYSRGAFACEQSSSPEAGCRLLKTVDTGSIGRVRSRGPAGVLEGWGGGEEAGEQVWGLCWW